MVKEIEYDVARLFIEKWHYSRKIPRGSHILFGWFLDGELYAVADFGNGVNPYQASFLSKATNEKVTNKNFVELKRLCRVEPKKDVYLTQFLSKCFKLLRKKDIKYIVSFSDPEYGHSGGIYKAANFKHIGKTQEEMHTIDKNGIKHHRRYAYRYAKANNCSIGEAREVLGLKPVKTLPKDRWFYKI